MFPVDKRTAQNLWYSAPDVIPELCFAVDEVPVELWNSHRDLYALADAIEPHLKRHGARKWDFVWSMERHFSEPYGPLPKAQQNFMAGIPDMFLPHEEGLPEASATTGGDGVLAEQAHLNVTSNQGNAEARPFQFDANDEVPDEYRAWLEKLFFAHGECMIPFFGEDAKHIEDMYAIIDASMIRQAPDAKSRLRFSNFTNEELRHTFQFYALYTAYDAKLPFKIYEHETQVFRAYMDLKTDGSWVDYGIFNMLADRLGTYQAFEWVQSSYAPLARVALKVVKDERGHCNMGYLNVRDFIEREGDEGRAHVQKRIDEHFYPFHMAAFGGSASRNNEMWRKWGLKQHTNDELRAAYHSEMALVLDSLGLAAPDFDDATARGLEQVAAMRSAAEANAEKGASAAE